MKATKGNKVYSIDESQKQFYIDGGFDILNDEGAVIAYGRGKTVPYEQYAALKAKIDRMSVSPEDDQDTLEILKAYAGEHGVDLGKSTSIAGIVRKIKAGEGAGEQ